MRRWYEVTSYLKYVPWDAILYLVVHVKGLTLYQWFIIRDEHENTILFDESMTLHTKLVQVQDLVERHVK